MTLPSLVRGRSFGRIRMELWEQQAEPWRIGSVLLGEDITEVGTIFGNNPVGFLFFK